MEKILFFAEIGRTPYSSLASERLLIQNVLSINNYFNSLKIEKNNLIAIKSLIFLLTYFIPDKSHPLIRANNDLRLLQKKFSLSDLLKINNISSILNNSQKILDKLSINLENLNFSSR